MPPMCCHFLRPLSTTVLRERLPFRTTLQFVTRVPWDILWVRKFRFSSCTGFCTSRGMIMTTTRVKWRIRNSACGGGGSFPLGSSSECRSGRPAHAYELCDYSYAACTVGASDSVVLCRTCLCRDRQVSFA